MFLPGMIIVYITEYTIRDEWVILYKSVVLHNSNTTYVVFCMVFSKKEIAVQLSIILHYRSNFETLGPKQIEWKQRFVVIIISMKHWNCPLWIADKQNDSSISLEWLFQWNTRIVLQVSCCYHFVTHLSLVLWIADSAQMSLQNNNKMITAKYM